MAPALSSGGDTSQLRREALARVPGCEKGRAPISVTPLQGGTSNAVFRVQTHLGYFVMRLNEPEAPQLGVDRAREAVLHRAAAAAGLAPAVVVADTAGRFLITEYISASPWTAEDMGDAQRLDSLGEKLRQLHALGVPAVAAFSLEALLRHHAGRAIEGNPTEAAQLHALVGRAESILMASRAQSRREPAIIHNDMHYSNLIGQGHRLRLVDWEYAAVADPLYDLACLLAYYPQAEPYAARLLEVTGLSIRASVEELTEIAWVYVLLSYLWYRTRASLAPASREDREAERGLRARLGI
jgi:thiamine kinase-like enzyme